MSNSNPYVPQAFHEFLLWEHATKDTIDFKKIYVDMAGDLNAGLMLSEIVYWYLPSQTGKENKLQVKREGFKWIACRRYEWWERTRLSPKEADRALTILIAKKLVTKDRFKFAGEVTVHVRLHYEVFMQQWKAILEHPPENPFLPKVEIEIDKKVKTKSPKKANPVTESTSENTLNNPANADDVPTTDEKPMTFDDFPEMDWSTVKNRQQQMKEVVHQVWGFPVGSTRNTMFEQMLRGKSTNKTVKDGNIPPEYGKRFEPCELGDWHDWYMTTGVKSVDKVIPTSAPIIQASIMEWIDAGKPSKKNGANPLDGFQEVD